MIMLYTVLISTMSAGAGITRLFLISTMCAGITRLFGLMLKNVIGDKMYNIYIVPYTLFFLGGAPVIALVQYVLGQHIVLNLKELSELRKEELERINILIDNTLAELGSDEYIIKDEDDYRETEE